MMLIMHVPRVARHGPLTRCSLAPTAAADRHISSGGRKSFRVLQLVLAAKGLNRMRELAPNEPPMSKGR